jgi:hypothetical protein
MFQRRRGVSLDEFKKYYPQFQKGVETHAEFRRLDEAIQFLEENGGYSYPEPKPGMWISEGMGWVAIEGYMPLHKHPPDWFANQVRFKYLVNVVAIHSRILVLDSMSAKIWEQLASNPMACDKAFHWLLLVRPTLPDRGVSNMDVLHAINATLQKGVDPARLVQNGRLSTVQEHCSVPSLGGILSGEWVPAPRKTFWFDGCEHLLLLPSWIFKIDMSYEISDWTYFL